MQIWQLFIVLSQPCLILNRNNFALNKSGLEKTNLNLDVSQHLVYISEYILLQSANHPAYGVDIVYLKNYASTLAIIYHMATFVHFINPI